MTGGDRDGRRETEAEREYRILVEAFHLFRCIDGAHIKCAEAAAAALRPR